MCRWKRCFWLSSSVCVPKTQDSSDFPKTAAKVWATEQCDAEKEVRRLKTLLEEEKKHKRNLLDSMLDGTISNATCVEANEECCAEIAATEQELQAITPRQATQYAFLQFTRIHLMDVAWAWQLAAPEQRHGFKLFCSTTGWRTLQIKKV